MDGWIGPGQSSVLVGSGPDDDGWMGWAMDRNGMTRWNPGCQGGGGGPSGGGGGRRIRWMRMMAPRDGDGWMEGMDGMAQDDDDGWMDGMGRMVRVTVRAGADPGMDGWDDPGRVDPGGWVDGSGGGSTGWAGTAFQSGTGWNGSGGPVDGRSRMDGWMDG